MTELRPFAELPGLGRRGRARRGARRARSGARPGRGDAPRPRRVRRALRRSATSSSPGRARSTRRRGQGKAPGVVAGRCAAAGVRCVVFGGRVRRRSTGCETVALSGEPAPRRGRPRGSGARLAGRAKPTRATRRRRGGRPSPRAASRRPAGAPRRTAGRRRPAGRTPSRRRRGHGRGARAAVDERDLAERGAGADRATLPRRGPRRVSSPLSTTKNMSPPSPSSATSRPAEKRRSLNSSARLCRSRSSRSEKRRTFRRSSGARLRHGAIHTRSACLLSRHRIGRVQLLDLELGALEPRGARGVQLLAAAEERDRLVDRHIAALEARRRSPRARCCSSSNERSRHGRTSSTVAPSAPAASSMSRGSPRPSRRRVPQRAASRADDRVATVQRRERRERLQARAGAVEPARLRRSRRSAARRGVCSP